MRPVLCRRICADRMFPASAFGDFAVASIGQLPWWVLASMYCSRRLQSAAIGLQKHCKSLQKATRFLDERESGRLAGELPFLRRLENNIENLLHIKFIILSFFSHQSGSLFCAVLKARSLESTCLFTLHSSSLAEWSAAGATAIGPPAGICWGFWTMLALEAMPWSRPPSSAASSCWLLPWDTQAKDRGYVSWKLEARSWLEMYHFVLEKVVRCKFWISRKSYDVAHSHRMCVECPCSCKKHQETCARARGCDQCSFTAWGFNQVHR